MKFCTHCKNMLYIDVEKDELELKYFCKNCNFTTMEENRQISHPLIENNYGDDISNYSQYMTSYIKYDPTLPRVRDIKCPNSACMKPKDKDNEVIYIKYDQANMKYLYYCCHCEQFWKS